MKRSGARIVALCVVFAAVVVVIGIHEKHHEQAFERHGIATVRAAIGPSLTHPGPTDYLYPPGRSCVFYAAGGRPFALELCIDEQGRVVEGVDRRGKTSKFYSLTEEPGATTLRISPQLVASLIKRVEKSAG